MFYGLRRRIGPHKEILRALWQNRDSLPRAWRILNEGVCDGCALGTRGLKDWTIDGVHLCWIRLNLLRLNTMGPLDPARLEDISALQTLSEKELRGLGRLHRPLLRRAGENRFRELEWDEALALAGAGLSGDPERLAFYVVSRGTLNETYYACQKAVRALGSNAIDNSARICHAPSTVALKESLGFGATTCSYKDLFDCGLLLLFGSDVANNQPVMMKYIHLARKRGLKVVVINPYHEPGMDRYWVPSNLDSALLGTRVADMQVPVRVGGDLALANALLKYLIEKDALDHAFIREHTNGWPELQQDLAAQGWDELCASAGLPRETIEQLGAMLAASRSTIVVWSMGITMHERGTDTVQALVNLALAGGHIGRPGCGVMPIRGHSGVQGGAEMGCAPNLLPGGLPLSTDNLARFEAEWGFPLPGHAGPFAAEMLERAEAGQLDTLWCVGSNLFAVFPDPRRVRAALENIPLRVHHDIVLNPQALVPAREHVLLLPATTRYELEGGGTETTTERRVIFNAPIPGSRVPHARDEWRVLRDAVSRARPDRATALSWQSTAELRAEISRCVTPYAPIANLSMGGDSFQIGGPLLGVDGIFGTADQRARFVSHRPDPAPPVDGLFAISTRRGNQFNSMVFGEKDMLSEENRQAVVLNPADMAALTLRQNDRVRVSSETGSLEGRVRTGRLARGTVMLCWPEANVLIPSGRQDPRCGIPAYRDVRVRVEKAP